MQGSMTVKSIIEEGSSIAKAIETAWIRAGKPVEFKVKVFEEAKKNFFGFTKQPAKIAFIFGQETHVRQQPRDRRMDRPQQATQLYERKPMAKPSESLDARPVKRPLQQTGSLPWSDVVVTQAREFIDNFIVQLPSSVQSPRFEVFGNQLRITFPQSITHDPARDRQLYKSLSYIMLASLRTTHKADLRDAKIQLTTNGSESIPHAE